MASAARKMMGCAVCNSSVRVFAVAKLALLVCVSLFLQLDVRPLTVVVLLPIHQHPGACWLVTTLVFVLWNCSHRLLAVAPWLCRGFTSRPQSRRQSHPGHR
jgi:hypothetical protein